VYLDHLHGGVALEAIGRRDRLPDVLRPRPRVALNQKII